MGKTSPITDFPTLKFRFKGFATTKSNSPSEHSQSLTVNPENYLAWETKKKVLCVNIIEETDIDIPMNIIGVQMMTEHLFVFDMEKDTVWWKPTTECEL
ncbi:hypothetical protein M758_9G020900 [Ceratodon purpureus]|nr:hypothetical protein M758_9G020900 [Ceratodon purpureus]